MPMPIVTKKPLSGYSSLIGACRGTALVSILVASPALAEVGFVLQVTNGQIIRNGSPVEIDEGSLVEEGDVLATEPDGLIQVELIDGTNFVVYADSTINIDTALIGSDESTFESLAVGISGGIFRLVSGSSDAEAFEITTPNATMGIRGTIVEYNYTAPFTYILGTDQESTIRLNDANGRPIESSGVVNPGACNMFRVGPAGIEEIPQPNLRETMPSACHRQEIFLTRHRSGGSCAPELLCDDFDPAFDENIDELLAEVEEINEDLEAQSGEEELEEDPENENEADEDGVEEDDAEEGEEESDEEGEENDSESEEQQEGLEEGSLNPENFLEPRLQAPPPILGPIPATAPALIPNQRSGPTTQTVTQSGGGSFAGRGSSGVLGSFGSFGTTTVFYPRSNRIGQPASSEDCVEPNSTSNICN
ncbi:hypothetical protein C1J05_11515 [Sulfitobacter sp. JL08]|nr:hypothetical protein C1J05_11515 [Sulfitobacter sp. JL08]